jgi:hypothetical protein
MKRKFQSEGAVSELPTLLRQIVEKLNAAPELERGGLYHTLRVPMNERLTALGYTNVPHLLLLMQEIGLLRKWGGGAVTVWQVVCFTFFDEVVTPAWLDRAHACLEKHVETTRLLSTRKGQTTEREAQGANPVGVKSIEEIAEMVVTIERLETTVEALNAEVDTLKHTLAERPTFDPDAALADAIKRARERTK